MAATNFLGQEIDQYIINKDSLEGLTTDIQVTNNLKNISSELPKYSILYGEKDDHYSMHITDENGSVKPVFYGDDTIAILRRDIQNQISNINTSIQALNNTINRLHKISKSGSYKDLNNVPQLVSTIKFNGISNTPNSQGVVELNYEAPEVILPDVSKFIKNIKFNGISNTPNSQGEVELNYEAPEVIMPDTSGFVKGIKINNGITNTPENGIVNLEIETSGGDTIYNTDGDWNSLQNIPYNIDEAVADGSSIITENTLCEKLQNCECCQDINNKIDKIFQNIGKDIEGKVKYIYTITDLNLSTDSRYSSGPKFSGGYDYHQNEENDMNTDLKWWSVLGATGGNIDTNRTPLLNDGNKTAQVQAYFNTLKGNGDPSSYQIYYSVSLNNNTNEWSKPEILPAYITIPYLLLKDLN